MRKMNRISPQEYIEKPSQRVTIRFTFDDLQGQIYRIQSQTSSRYIYT